ncbi:hypothetical protein AAG747_29060 [Rapidithrix thailandica]|uniref:Uncharacterized protein n=1 Tax=Rapidithrix thailandica TaxID=413964 RepID=A0AAW9SH93_9BACT
MLALMEVVYVLCVCEGIWYMNEIRHQKASGYGYEPAFRKGYGTLVPRVHEMVLFLEYLSQYLEKVKSVQNPKLHSMSSRMYYSN